MIDFIEVTLQGRSTKRLINVQHIVEVRAHESYAILVLSAGDIVVEETYRDIYNMLHDVAFFRHEAEAALQYKYWLSEIEAEKCPKCAGKGSIRHFDGECTEYDLCERCGGLCYLPSRHEFPEHYTKEELEEGRL